MMAAFAEHEAKTISERTKAALAAAKARGRKPGNPRWQESIASARHANRYQDPPARVLALMQRLHADRMGYCAIAEYLNDLGNRTHRGKRWYGSTVRRALMHQCAPAVPHVPT